MYVIDASVIIKWYVDEQDSDKALKILEDYEAETYSIVIPDLAVYEVANVLRCNSQFTADEAKKSLWALSKLNLDLISPVPAVIQPAIDIAYKKDVSLYDAVYVSLAKEIGYYFITADAKLCEKLSDFGNVKLLSSLEVSAESRD